MGGEGDGDRGEMNCASWILTSVTSLEGKSLPDFFPIQMVVI